MSSPVLNHITKVECIDSYRLKDCQVINGRGILLNGWRDFTTLPTVGLSNCTAATKVLKKNTLYTVKLTANLKSRFEPGNRHLCYRLTTASGGQFLLGTYAKPYVISNTSEVLPDVVTDKSVTTLTAEYSNTFGLLAILD